MRERRISWRNGLEAWPRKLPSFTLSARAAALIVVDVQRYDIDPTVGLGAVIAREHPEYARYYFTRLRETVIPNIQHLLSFFRDNALRVVYLTVGPECSDGADYRLRRRIADIEQQEQRRNATIFPRGTREHEIVPELAPRPDEIVLNKTTSSAFTSTGIDHLLRALRLTDLVFVGVTTEACVESTARSAADRGYACVVVDDACQTLEEDAHEASLRAFARNFGRVAACADVIDELRATL